MTNTAIFRFDEEYVKKVAKSKRFIAACRKSRTGNKLFNKATLREHGEYVVRMRVLQSSRIITAEDGNTKECWVLVSYRNKDSEGKTRIEYYITTDDYSCIHMNKRILQKAG